MTLHSAFSLGLVFGGETDGIWIRVLHRNCSCICKLDVGLLNHPNWTFISQVMVHFPGLPQLRLFIYLCLDFEDFRIVLRTDFMTVQNEKSGLSRTGLVR